MQTIFDPSTCEALLRRVDAVHTTSARQWGKMSAAQMLEHTARALEVATGRKPATQAFVGKAIGWIFKAGFLGEKPFAKNSPTAKRYAMSPGSLEVSGRAGTIRRTPDSPSQRTIVLCGW
jgi:hypothetical protein